jgi:hypothetical protein
MTIRARCVANAVHRVADAKARERLERAIHVEGALAELTVGETYDVVALEERSGGVWLFIHTVLSSECPYPYPAEMFDIVDASLPAGWWITFETQTSGLVIKRISFRQWAQDGGFYEKLVDRDTQALEVYNRQRRPYV